MEVGDILISHQGGYKRSNEYVVLTKYLPKTKRWRADIIGYRYKKRRSWILFSFRNSQ